MVAVPGTVQLRPVALGSFGIEYTFPVELAHTVAGPVIGPGCAGAPVITDDNLGRLLPHELFAITESCPDEKVFVKATVTNRVPCPEAMLAFAGAVHV